MQSLSIPHPASDPREAFRPPNPNRVTHLSLYGYNVLDASSPKTEVKRRAAVAKHSRQQLHPPNTLYNAFLQPV